MENRKKTLLEISGEMKWKWLGKDIPLNKLHNNQLNTIIKTIEKYPNNWYGYTSNAWYNAIKCVIKNRTFTEMHKQKVIKATIKADIILNHFKNSTFLK